MDFLLNNEFVEPHLTQVVLAIKYNIGVNMYDNFCFDIYLIQKNKNRIILPEGRVCCTSLPI